MAAAKIKKGDRVIVLSGKDKGVKGKVLVAMPSENKVIVEKVNVATCHTKPRKQGETGGIVKRETPIRSCKVALFCEKCGKGVRVGHKIEDGKKTRICRKCGAEDTAMRFSGRATTDMDALVFAESCEVSSV